MKIMRGNDPRIDDLRKMDVFRGCDDKQLAAIAAFTTTVDVGPGRALCRQGAAGEEAFLLVDGEAEATAGGTVVGTLGAGDVFGEIAVLGGFPRTATVTTVTQCRLLVMARQELESVLAAAPSVLRRVLTLVTERLQPAEVDKR